MHLSMILLALTAVFLTLPLESSAICSKPENILSELFSSKMAFFNMSVDDIPQSVNWIERGVLTPVKDQSHVCGSCWAFATVATLESAWKIKTGNLISLSAQFLIDCATENLGCDGGWLSKAYRFATQQHGGGIPSEDSYPYKADELECRNNVIPTAGFSGFKVVPPNDEQQLLQAVVQQPVTVNIATPDPAVTLEFNNFKGGEIYSGPCGVSGTNHAVVIVGYGATNDGTKYWLIRNSWGESWGESGYFRLIRGTGIPGGRCGIHSGYAFYPST